MLPTPNKPGLYLLTLLRKLHRQLGIGSSTWYKKDDSLKRNHLFHNFVICKKKKYGDLPVQFQTWDAVVPVEDGGGGEGTPRGESRQRSNGLAFGSMYTHTHAHTYTPPDLESF